MKVLGIDYGDSRIGLAVCDNFLRLATPLKTIKSKTMRENIDTISDLIREIDAQLIVLGLPVNMDGTDGKRAEKTRAFGRNLEKVSKIEVVYQDERLSSAMAEEVLDKNLVKKSKRKNIIDTIAAQIILQSYLDSK